LDQIKRIGKQCAVAARGSSLTKGVEVGNFDFIGFSKHIKRAVETLDPDHVGFIYGTHQILPGDGNPAG
jgi:hypothetical protein